MMQTSRAGCVVAIVVAAIMLAACEAASPAAPSSLDRAQPRPSSAMPAPEATATADGSIERTIDPTPTPLLLGGTWVRPKAGATVSAYTTTLSAKPASTGDGATTFTKVVFSASWAGAKKKVVCTATKPGTDGVWGCKADLLGSGVPPGAVTFSFDVFGAGVPVARSTDGARRVTYAVPPPRPTKTRLEQLEQPDYEGYGDNSAILHRVRWSAPAGYADEFLLYETNECPRPSTRANSGKPCFVAGTPVDTTQLELLATARGDARSVKVRMGEGECGPSHGSILLRARNAYGKSVFAIVEAAPVLWVDPNDTFC